MKRNAALAFFFIGTFCWVCAYVAKECGDEYERLSTSTPMTEGGTSPLHPPVRAPLPVSGVSPATHVVAPPVDAEKERLAPESSSSLPAPPGEQAGASVPPPSPIMDKLLPKRLQNRALGSAGDRQVENARQVERLLWDKGYRQPKAIVAILANGWHESRWNAGTVYKEKNGTYSRGFFQLTNGALTIEGNVEQLTTKAPYAARIKKWYADFKEHNWSAGEAAYYFARRVEICASRFWNERKETAERWWLLMEEHK